MMKSIFFALFVLGVAKTLAVPVQDFNEYETSKEYYREVGMAFLGALSTEVQHKVPKTDLQGSHPKQSLKEYFDGLFAINLLAEMSHVLPDEEHHKMKRAIEETKNELETEIMPAVGELVVDMEKNGVNETSVEKIKKLLNKVEGSMGSLGRAVKSDTVKQIWKFLCSLFTGKFIDDENFTEKPSSESELADQPNSFGHTACSEETYQKTQEYIKNANEMIRNINRFFSKEKLETIRIVIKAVFESLKRAAVAVWEKIG